MAGGGGGRSYRWQSNVSLRLGSYRSLKRRSLNYNHPSGSCALAWPFEHKRWLICGGLWCKDLPLSGQQEGRGGGGGDSRRAQVKKMNCSSARPAGANVFLNTCPLFLQVLKGAWMRVNNAQVLTNILAWKEISLSGPAPWVQWKQPCNWICSFLCGENASKTSIYFW